MAAVNTNYFVCTLGEAALLRQHKNYKTIPEFIEVQARERPKCPAVGFYSPGVDSSKPWCQQIFTFRDIQRDTNAVAEALLDSGRLPECQTVALLCPSSAAFLLTWLALMQLGHPVLLIAPQCSPSAIVQLCKACQVITLLYDDSYEDLAQKASSNYDLLDCQPLPLVRKITVSMAAQNGSRESPTSPDLKDTDVAYFHHTSGTSSGMPKPVPQTHRAAIGVLPQLDGSKGATFTTTPLYHGGIADLFRAWTSHAMIWLFPGKDVPITAKNVVRCLDVTAQCSVDSDNTPVKYFSSVPYVLQMMADDDRGLKYLQSMEIVGVGGAALPDSVGMDLVRKEVNLVSRFGSAECGFLMSSHRDYVKDQQWQYLRTTKGTSHLSFEQRDGLSELVILPGWPHLAKSNREDGCYATSDLFAPHPDNENWWRYHSRADSQLTLITGKKFDPAPLEAAIARGSPFVDDVLIFGNGKPYPGALLFLSEKEHSTSDQSIISALTPIIERLNKESQSHAHISQHMLIPVSCSGLSLDKSSKGSILRHKAEERFAEQIESAYESEAVQGNHEISDAQVPDAILKVVQSVVGPMQDHKEDLSSDTDLFAYGIDSVACLQIRHALSQFLAQESAQLPLTAVEDSGSVSRLSELIIDLRHGRAPEQSEDQVQLMLDLVKRYSNFIDRGTSPPLKCNNRPEKQTIILTGATGSLGSHVLSQLISHPSISHIYLFLRGSTPQAARARIFKALSFRSLPVLDTFDSRVTIIPITLSQPDLSLDPETYACLAKTVTTIFHCAWSVNFLQPLHSFGATHLAGLRNLLNLALAGPRKAPARVVFCSSVASVSSYPHVSKSGSMTPERILGNPAVAGPTGYSRSKWVAEQICHVAHESTRLRNRVTVMRVGQLTGSRIDGVWNRSEAWPLMLGSLTKTGVLPDLGREQLNWLPVNEAAAALVANLVRAPDDEEDLETKVRHVVSPHTATWSALLSMLAKHESFEVVSPCEWLHKIALLQEDENTKHHPVLKLLGFWRNAYGGVTKEGMGDDGCEGVHVAGQWEMSKTLVAMPSLAGTGTIDEEYVGKLWAWIKENI